MSRRTKGEGSVFLRKSDGRWVATIPLGNRRRREFSGATQAEAIRKRNEARKSLDSGVNTPVNLTVGELAAQWIIDIEQSVKPRTLETYQGILKKHLLPELGNEKLASLQPSAIQRCYSHRAAAGASPKTIRNVAGVLHSLLERAVKWNLVTRNSASLVDLPRVPKREMKILNQVESLRLIGAAKGRRLEAFVVLALTTGARLGELAGLQWKRVDLDKGEIRLNKTLQETPNGFELSEPKTGASIRTNKLSEVAITALRQHQVQQNQLRKELGSAWSNDLDLVFTGVDGRPLTRRRILRQELRPAARAAGLADSLRTHDLRHTAISLLLNQGLPIPMVSSYVGHADPSVTLRVYAHAIPSTQHEVADAAQSLFGA